MRRLLPAARMRWREERFCALLFLLEGLVDSLDEHRCSPGTSIRAVSPIEIHRGPGRFHLLESHTFVNGVLNTVANHREHIPVRSHIGGIRQPAVTGNNPRASLPAVLRDGEVQNVIQTVDDALNTSTLFDIDNRISDR